MNEKTHEKYTGKRLYLTDFFFINMITFVILNILTLIF